MGYKKINLLIRNIYEFVKEKIEDEGYIIGDEEGQMGLFDSFPVIEFKLPAISIDFVGTNPMVESDLGHWAKREYPMVIDIFSRSKFERDSLTSTLIDALEKNRVALLDYTEATPSKIASISFDSIRGDTVRIVSAGQEQENRGAIHFVAVIESDY